VRQLGGQKEEEWSYEAIEQGSPKTDRPALRGAMLHSSGMVVIASPASRRTPRAALLVVACALVAPFEGVSFADSPPASGTVADAGPDPLAGARLVDGVVALIGKRIVTLSQLEQDARVSLANHGEIAEAYQPLDDRALASALDYLINQELVAGEARRLEVFEVSQAEIDAEEKSLSQRFHWPESLNSFLARFSIAESELQAILRRGLRARRYLDHRLRLQLEPDAGKPVAGPSVEELAASLVSDLRARSNVRILIDFHVPQRANTPDPPRPAGIRVSRP
jgi:hypothetical protein